MYSFDLISRVIDYKIRSNKSLRKIEKIFSVPKSTIHNWLINNTKKQHQIDKKNTEPGKILLFLKNSLNHNPFQTLSVLLYKINKKFNEDFSMTKIKNFMKLIGYTKKKVTLRKYNVKNLKDHILTRKQFKKMIKKINKDDIISLDEVGVTRNTFNHYGYAHKSKRLLCHMNINQSPVKKSIIVAINNKQVINYHIEDNRGINGNIFINFIKQLTSQITGKYILMDNIRFHKSAEVTRIIKETCNYPLFIPPYSPDFNPIEEYFSCFKNHIKKNVTPINSKNINDVIRIFFVTKIDLTGFYNHAFN